MASIFEAAGIDQQAVQEAGVQEVREGIQPGVYDVQVEKAYIRKTNSGAQQFELELKTEQDQRIFWSANVRKSDAKNNEINNIGTAAMKHFVDAIGGDDESINTTLEIRGETYNIIAFRNASGKRLKVAVQKEENTWNGNTTLKNKIFAFMKPDGTNAAGEDLVQKSLDKIEKQPIIYEKKSAQAQTQLDPKTAQEATASGW